MAGALAGRDELLLDEFDEPLAGGVVGRAGAGRDEVPAAEPERPGALERVAPPLATARAAAESAGLDDPGRDGAGLLDAGRAAAAPADEDEVGGGATGRVDSCGDAAGRPLEEDDGRPLLELDELDELDGFDGVDGRVKADDRDEVDPVVPEPEPAGGGAATVGDSDRPLLDPDPEVGVAGRDGAGVAGREGAGVAGREGAGDAGRDGAEEAGRDGADAGRDDEPEDVGFAVGVELGRFAAAPVMVGVATVGAGEAGGRSGLVNADGVLVGAGVLAAGAAAGAAVPSGRAPVGRTRVVSSATPSLDSVDVTLGDASVVIGTVPPPGIGRGVLSGCLLLSELTYQPPCSSSRRGTRLSDSIRANRLASANKVHRTPLFGRY